ncbi:MAG: ribosome small subunit-dependent GTPase A [Planctomycetes bacterium]|nr:ribosome small subunit-dependent GTPase A [Planctomycetota bacterium]
MVVGRVVRIVGNEFHVETPQGLVRCTLTNKVRRAREGANKPAAVGDEVEVEPGEAGEGVFLKTLPRKTKLCRAKGSEGQLEGVLVANAEQVLAVFSARSPEPDFRAVDRALVMGEAGQMKCAIAINKVDLAGPPPEVAAYRKAGYPVFETCAVTGKGVDEVRAWIKGHTTVLMGPSGVGKSSLLNTIEPDWKRKVGALSGKIEEGRHTTTWVEMLPLEGGGWIVDTPGIESFGLWGISSEDLSAFFPEIHALEGKCRFGNCRHISEPGCAIKAAVERGEVNTKRWEGYRGLLKELQGSEGPSWK